MGVSGIMSGKIPDEVDIYKSKIFDWVFMTANYYKDIPDLVNVYIQDNQGVIHDYKAMSCIELEKRVCDEHWIFVKKINNQWFVPCVLKMEEK